MRVAAFILSAVTLAAKSYPVDGIVAALDPAARTMLVSHRPIAGYMPAMMMPFRVADPAELQGLYPGARVAFQLEVAKDHSLARNVRKSGAPDAAIPPPKETLGIGDALGGRNLQVARQELAGHIDIAAEQVARGLKQLEAASKAERRLTYTEPPYYPRPVAEAMGHAALRNRQPSFADRAFRIALQQCP